MKNYHNIGIVGLGNVGTSVIRLISENLNMLSDRSGKNIKIVAISARRKNLDRPISIKDYEWVTDPLEMASRTNIDTIVELIGGEDGPALTLAEKTLLNSKNLVTANKAMLAKHGRYLSNIAEKSTANIYYEGAVAGGIPIVKVLREGLSANNVFRIYGILNGTCNFIMSKMEDSDQSFETTLKEAQNLGIAEVNPETDIEGMDAAHKLVILSNLAFGVLSNIRDVYIEGIKDISLMDITFAKELGYKIKLLGLSEFKNNFLFQRVHPCMIPEDLPLSNINSTYNAVVIESDKAPSTLIVGHGAGGDATASAVVADIVDIVRERVTPIFGITSEKLSSPKNINMDDREGKYYIRLNVIDTIGVIADVGRCLRNSQVSIGALLQKEYKNSAHDGVPIIIITHKNKEKNVNIAVKTIAELKSVINRPVKIRIEEF